MAQVIRQQEERKSRKAQSNGRGFKNTVADGNVADWMSVSPEALQFAIAAAAWRGGAIRFGYTRDGGAYAIGVYGDGEPYTEYLPPGSDVDKWLKELGEFFRERTT